MVKDKLLGQTEKTRLSDYARDVVARASRAKSVAREAASSAEHVDAFSPEDLQARLLKLEKEFDALDRKVERNFSAVLTTLKRMEARTSQASGELRAVREDIDAIAGSAAYAREELTAVVKEHGASIISELALLVERLETPRALAATDKAVAIDSAAATSDFSIQDEGFSSKGSQRGGTGARRDG